MNWRRLLLIAGTLAVVGVAGLIVVRRPDLQILTATGAAADALCAKIFVSHLDPETSFAEIVDRPGIRRLKFAMRYFQLEPRLLQPSTLPARCTASRAA